MRKPRDIDAELKALQERQKQLKVKRTQQLGELVATTGAADVLDSETMAGLLLEAVERLRSEPQAKEAWRRRGEAFFRRDKRARKAVAANPAARDATDGDGAASNASRTAAE